MSRLLSSLLVAALLVPLAACGEDEPAARPAEQTDPSAPTTSPSAQVTMLEPPADYSVVEGNGFTIGAPGEFQQQRTTSSNGEPMLVLEKPSQVEALPQRVAVIRDVRPKTPAIEQSFALETAKAAAGPEAEVERTALPTEEEGQSAFLITWKETLPGEGGDGVSVTYWQLMHQVSPDLIINVVALAPTEEFETSEVSRILRTFVPTASA